MTAFPARTDWIAWMPWLLLLLLSGSLQMLDAYPVLRLELPVSGLHWLYTGLSCHLVHISSGHLLADAFALSVIAILFHREYGLPCWLLTYAVSTLAVSTGVILFPQDLHSYAGLSGILHGLFVSGCLQLYPRRPRLALLLLALMVIKLVLEPGLIARGLVSPGFRVAYVAHYAGCLGGVFSCFACRLFRRRHNPG